MDSFNLRRRRQMACPPARQQLSSRPLAEKRRLTRTGRSGDDSPGQCGRTWLSAFAIGALCLVTACGQPGAPQPPSLNLPVPVRDLSAVRTGNTVHLEWSVTDRTTDHTVPAEPIRTRLCRMEGTGPCELVTEQPTHLGKRESWDDLLPTEETQGTPQLLTYYIELQNHAHKSAGRSNPGYAADGKPLAQIVEPKASVLAQGVELQWPPSEWPEAPGTQRLVRIYRDLTSAAPATHTKSGTGRLAEKSPEPATQNLEVVLTPAPSPVEPGRALDASARFGETYTYQLQRVEKLTMNGHAVEILGPRSTPVSIATRDVFPPAAPQQLDAVADNSSHSIDLSWSPDSEPDLAGYYVYRSEKGSGEAKPGRISGPTPINVPSYRDTTASPGISYVYQVSAVDQSGNESQPSNDAEESLASQPKQ